MALKQQQQRRSGSFGAAAPASSAAMDPRRQPCANARGPPSQADQRPLPSSFSIDSTRPAARDGGGGAAANEEKKRSFGSSNHNNSKPVTNTAMKTMMRRKDCANLQARKETAAQLTIKSMPITAKFKTMDLGEIRKGTHLTGDHKTGLVSRNANKEEGGGDEKKIMRRKSISGSLECDFAEMGAKILAVDMPPFMQAHAVTCARAAHEASVGKPGTKNLAFALKKEFDKVYGPAWHCIVGTSFGSFVTHSVGGFLYFSLDKLYILLFKTSVQRAE
ncbi:uncharacterized protein LOC116255583 isoform X1 [Nymphaea colorata]|nr:uncharacterized protein LOC116255583 isoform X1 [Nymphaea colorata]